MGRVLFYVRIFHISHGHANSDNSGRKCLPREEESRMAVGLILLSIVTALVLFGAAQRVLDRMQLSDRPRW